MSEQVAGTSAGSSAPSGNGKKKRRVNYTKEEQLQLVEFVKRRKVDLFGKAGYCGVKVEQRKQGTWKELATLLRSCGGPERDWRELKKKWQELKSRALKCTAHAKLTGGGPPKSIDFISEKVLEAVATEVREGLASSQNEAGLGECTSSQDLEVAALAEDTNQSMVNDEEDLDLGDDIGDIQVLENLDTVTQLVTCPPDVIHADLLRISGQLDTIIDLLVNRQRGGNEQ
ncbi:uncharacterized protein LOC121405984 isoform X1 [Lytechinus variegatus]|uniref:uncharacterized protein LOC121405984 isoform X1 n=1 Tax=Lytechinus variegatus TaxID=7654 RepID=UPI001BB1CE98|nr:uncharacterized protein LOC121405984 isoform X1 [Lytechinus variegatus]